MLCSIRGALCAIAGFISPIVVAGHYAVEASLGRALPEAESYERASQGSLGLALRHGNWSYHLGYVTLSQLALTNAAPETGIEIDGTTFSVSRTASLQAANIRFGGGVFASSTEATFSGESVAEERDISPFLEAEGSLPLSRHWEARVGYRYFFDVSGSDLQNPYLGVSWSF